jgi:hypothetical protein
MSNMNTQKLNWTTEKRKLKDLIPYEHNPRILTDKQYRDLKTSLEKFNLAEIPAINTDNLVLAGHQRLKIMLEVYGTEHEIDVRMPNRKLSEKECQEYNIRSNKNTGEFDFEMLADVFEADNLMEWGFSDYELINDSFIDDLEEKGIAGVLGENSTEFAVTFTLDKKFQTAFDSLGKKHFYELLENELSNLMESGKEVNTDLATFEPKTPKEERNA